MNSGNPELPDRKKNGPVLISRDLIVTSGGVNVNATFTTSCHIRISVLVEYRQASLKAQIKSRPP